MTRLKSRRPSAVNWCPRPAAVSV